MRRFLPNGFEESSGDGLGGDGFDERSGLGMER